MHKEVKWVERQQLATGSYEKFQISFISCECPMGFNFDSSPKTQSECIKNCQVYDLLLNIGDENVFSVQYFGDCT